MKQAALNENMDKACHQQSLFLVLLIDYLRFGLKDDHRDMRMAYDELKKNGDYPDTVEDFVRSALTRHFGIKLADMAEDFYHDRPKREQDVCA